MKVWVSVDTQKPSGSGCFFLLLFTFDWEPTLTGSIHLCSCVCVWGARRCKLKLPTCFLFMEAKTHSRQSYICMTGETVKYRHLQCIQLAWQGLKVRTHANGKATWLPLVDFVCSGCSQLWGISCQNSFWVVAWKLYFTKLNHHDSEATLSKQHV